jgi:Asp-tRNA(Asn)/Glu-tRNA(Gln) amidotransferase A subunit family amidase
MEWVRLVREAAWRNAGFASLRAVAPELLEYEPLYEPTIVPLPEPEPEPSARQLTSSPPPAHAYPQSRHYSVADYHALFLSGSLTPRAVAVALLPLIAKGGPHGAAWLQVNAAAVLAAAEASTLRYKTKKPLGPLDGVPTAVKDEYDLDGYRTCLGSPNNYTGPPGSTSWCVARLEAAGAVVLGKLHMVEFGLDTPGNNPHLPPLTNPHNAGYYTGGSSSGAGYAVGAGLIPVALGSDGGGSIRIPASWCGVFGLKPSHGRLSTRPGPNHCITCACLGPLAADVRSLAEVYRVVGQPHPESLFPAIPSVPSLLGSGPGRRRVLGVPAEWISRADPAVKRLFDSMLDGLVTKHGYRAVPITLPFLVQGQVAHALTVLNDGATLLPDTRGLSATTKILLALGRTTPATDYTLAQKLRRLLVQHLAHLWRENPGMVIVTPTTACAGWKVGANSEFRWGLSDGDTTLRSMEYVWLANFCGLPSLSSPMGYVVPAGQPNAGEVAKSETPGKVPVGFMATGEWGDEDGLLKLGLDVEEFGAGLRARAEKWVDVVELAGKAEGEDGVCGNGH